LESFDRLPSAVVVAVPVEVLELAKALTAGWAGEAGELAGRCDDDSGDSEAGDDPETPITHAASPPKSFE
jgi:hypothetical protein